MVKSIDSQAARGSQRFVSEVAAGGVLDEVYAFFAAIYQRDLGAVPTGQPTTSETYFVVRAPSGLIVASCRLLGPSARPFDFEAKVSLADLKPPLPTPALVGRLCVHPDFRNASSSLSIHHSLLAKMVNYARSEAISDLVLYTYDHLRNFYRIGGFADTMITFDHPFWGLVRLMRRQVTKGQS